MTKPNLTNYADTVASNFYQYLLTGNTSAILDAFEGEPRIDAPRSGAVVGREAVQGFLKEERSWLESLGASIDGLKEVKKTSNSKRIVQEVGILLPPVPPKPRPHMFAIVADISAGGISAIRLYYCYGFISGNEEFLRAAMLPADASLYDALPPVVRSYADCIAAADFNVVKLFAEGASLMGVPSIPFRGCQLAKFFAAALAEKEGVPLQLATLTSDTKTCAIEENIDSWGSIQFERSTAGLAVYDYDDSGHLTAVRIYDDIPDNPFSRPGLILNNWELISSRIKDAGCECNFAPSAELTPKQIKAKLLFS